MRTSRGTIQERPAKVTCAALLSIVALAACAPQWPQAGPGPSAAARAAPELPLLTGPEIAAALGPGASPEAIEAATRLAGRAAALRARARALAGPVLAPAERRRLLAGLRAAQDRLAERN